MRLRAQYSALLIALLLAPVFVTLAGCGQKKPVQFETSKVQRGPIIAKVSANGTLSALVTVQVGAQVSGRIQTLGADFNSTVKKGEVLAALDPELFKAAQANARANEVAAEGILKKDQVLAENLRMQLSRSKELAHRGIVTQQDLDTAQAAFDAATAQAVADQGNLEQAKAALNQAEINLGYTTIHSPINGVVISRNVDIGQTVAASLQAPVLFLIAEDLRKMQVDTNVAEADVGRLHSGMEASFTVDAYPGEVFHGVIRQVRNNATIVQNVVTYDAVIDVANQELKLRPSMTANVTVIVGERRDALTVANAAMRFRPPQQLLRTNRPGGEDQSAAAANGPTPLEGAPPRSLGGGQRGGQADQGTQQAPGAAKPQPDRTLRTVWIRQDGTLRPIKIRAGLTDGTRTEVVEGELKEGDQLVTDVIGLESGPSGFRAL